MKVCHFCGNKNFRKTQVQYTYKHHDNFLIVNDVPCEQCEFCGEQCFKGSVLKQIENEFFSIHSRCIHAIPPDTGFELNSVCLLQQR